MKYIKIFAKQLNLLQQRGYFITNIRKLLKQCVQYGAEVIGRRVQSTTSISQIRKQKAGRRGVT